MADVHATLQQLHENGITLKIVTGDNELVSRHLCKEISFNIEDVLTGDDLHEMDDTTLRARVGCTNLFCRVNPSQKNRIILALKSRGHTVGFLGDGINDAPSLHSADIGISVDSAADVARQAADIILLKRDLQVLNTGVMEGRRTFANIMKYIMMGTSSNFGNMFSMAGAALFLPFLPMLPVQVLVNNLLYDLSEIAIPLDRVDESYLRQPHDWDISFVRRFMWVVGPVSSVFDFLTFFVLLTMFSANESLFQTGWFIESVATQVLVIFVIRTRASPLKSRPAPALVWVALGVVLFAMALPFTTLGKLLGFVAPPPSLFGVVAVLVVVYLFGVEVVKRGFYTLQHA